LAWTSAHKEIHLNKVVESPCPKNAQRQISIHIKVHEKVLKDLSKVFPHPPRDASYQVRLKSILWFLRSLMKKLAHDEHCTIT